jgi:hypothetical protein
VKFDALEGAIVKEGARAWLSKVSAATVAACVRRSRGRAEREDGAGMRDARRPFAVDNQIAEAAEGLFSRQDISIFSEVRVRALAPLSCQESNSFRNELSLR